MKWKKLGKVFEPDGTLDWMATHAMMPCVNQIDEDVFRVYFSPRDSQNRSRPASLDFNIKDPFDVFNLTRTPILELGPLGAYDDSGVMPTCIVEHDGKKYMYYNGWTLGKNIPFFSFNGVAESDDGIRFTKISRAPIALYRNSIDPFSTFAPFVRIEEDKWRMWYVSCTGWELENEEPKHYYHIKYAESLDGLNWQREGVVCIDFKDEQEYALARPMVVKDKQLYRMWFSYRGEKYTIGYAESENGIDWERKDEEAGIAVSQSGWDSEMICYPFVFDHKGDRYMLYNGNGYGKTGFGLAILEQE